MKPKTSAPIWWCNKRYGWPVVEAATKKAFDIFEAGLWQLLLCKKHFSPCHNFSLEHLERLEKSSNHQRGPMML